MEKPEHPGPCALPAALTAYAAANAAYSDWLATQPVEAAESETAPEAPPPKPVKGAK